MIPLSILVDVLYTSPGNFLVWTCAVDDDIDPDLNEPGTFYLEILVIPFNDELPVLLLEVYSSGHINIYDTNLPAKSSRAIANNPLSRIVQMGNFKFGRMIHNLRDVFGTTSERMSSMDLPHLLDIIDLLLNLSGFKSDTDDEG